AVPACRAQLRMDLVGPVAALASQHHVHLLQQVDLARGVQLPVAEVGHFGRRAAGVRRAEEDGLDVREVVLLAHALHQHGTDHSAPPNHRYLQHDFTPWSRRRHAPASSYSAASTASPISFVPTVRLPGSAMSAVRKPCASTLRTARSMRCAPASWPKVWRSSIADDRIVASGFATSRPAMSGAEPWIGSYSPKPRAFSDADGNIPIDPVSIDASSDR